MRVSAIRVDKARKEGGREKEEVSHMQMQGDRVWDSQSQR